MKYPLCTIVLLLLGISVFTSCSDNTKPVKAKKGLMPAIEEPEELEPGIHDKSVVASSGSTLRYTIAIPETYNSSQPTPLIVALHFGGKVTPHYSHGIVEMLVQPGLGELSAIIVALDSIAGPWNNEKNEEAVLELMDYISIHYNIDEDRVVLTGFSMGGHGTWYLGSRNQDLFSALIPIAGAPQVEPGIEWTTPIYAIHSRADKVVPIEPTEKYLAPLMKDDSHNVVFITVDDLPHFQTARFALPLKEAVPWVREIWSGDE